ncbi:S8 family serine peptidase [Nocardiopsis sp. CC223A]|uniref:S8 family serine peptidase n=1 Tax=Nocardiopsis sp. CC223A TaxID=3044051 RepID=UPI00278BF194|nr:S8 family serine peptidase [Nocardiopsis sp. CC223A]
MTDSPATRVRIGRAAVLALLLGQFAFAPAARADAPEPPPPLPQVHEFKAENQACGSMGTDVVERRPWTHATLGLDEAHRLSTGEGVTIALLAPELDATGPALEGAVRGSAGTSDCLGYGTFLAGAAVGRPVEGSGTVGVAPGADLLFLPTGSPNTGVASPEEIAAGVAEAADEGAAVILVGTSTWLGSEALDGAVEDATAAGSLVVAPATVNTVRGPIAAYPAQHPQVLSVAAHGPEGTPLVAAPLLRPDGELVRVGLLAPGDLTVAPGPGGGHVIGSGAGAASAFAAGAAALLAASRPELTAEELRDRLLATAYAAPAGDKDPVSGSGRVDPVAALVTGPVEERAPVAGAAFVPDPSPRGSLDALPTWAVVGGFSLLLVVCVLGAAVVRNGRSRGWRPAAPGEPVPTGPVSGPDAEPRPS